MPRRYPRFVLSAAFLICLASAHAQSASQPIQLSVDVTDAPRKIIHAVETMPITPGEHTLVYPKWIPGEHGPTGPIDDLTGLMFTVNGRQIPWRRDDVDMFAFHIDVPAGVTELKIKLDFLATASPSGFSSGASTSASLAMLSWNTVVLYPDGAKAADVMVTPEAKIPQGWRYGTALTKTNSDSYDLKFDTVSLEQLVDSPLLTGRYFREWPLAPEVSPKHYLDVAADGPEDLEIKPDLLAGFNNLVRETGALYKSRHYNSYHFLLTASDQVAHFGLEHHQSSDDRIPEKSFLDPNLSLLIGGLLPHEFTHSWNGKYRRPAGLATPNYQVPMKGNLLWVYEGLTEYLGDVLTARSGIWTPEQYRDALALSAATLDYRPGRTWRDLSDTAVAAQILYDAGDGWDNWRRNVDYYPEGELVWLEVDTMIRKQTNGKKSLNDFCARFYNPSGDLAPRGLGDDTAPKVVPYTFGDIVENLNAVTPHDWADFLHERLTTKQDHAPLGGITNGGWRLAYSDKETPYVTADEHGGVNAWWSLGLKIGDGGKVSDVLVGSLADKAGFGPDMQIVAVNGRAYQDELLKRAIDDAKEGSAQQGVTPEKTGPIEFIVSNTSYFKVLKIDYHSGQRYPYLERVKGEKDMLEEILKPLAPVKK
jgi:predicted metalloprotease with PDZ domain